MTTTEYGTDTTTVEDERIDDPNVDPDEYEEDETSDPNTGSTRSRGASASNRQAGRDKALIRRALAKFIQIEEAPESARILAGEMVGADGTDAADLTVAVLTASKGQTSSALADLAALRSEEDMAAAALAATMPNDRIVALWRVLVALGGAKGAKPTGSGITRALNVVKTARALTDEQVGALDNAVALTKKTV